MASRTTQLSTDAEQRRLKEALVDELLADALKRARQTCRAPGVPAWSFEDAGSEVVDNLLNALNILTPAQIRQLLNGNLGQLGGALGGITGRGNTSGGGDGGLNVPDVQVPRANLNSTYQEPQPIDPFGLAAHGLDAGLGTMLLQGVAEVR